MRFLIGIIIGGCLTLLVATATGTPMTPWLEKLGARLTTTWSTMIEATAATVFDSSTQPGDNIPGEPELPVVLPRVLPGESPEQSFAETLLAPMPELEPTAVTESPGTNPAEPIELEDLPTKAAVWVPFHSQMSAQGFASRLTDALSYPFSVERQGPGTYQVMFTAESHQQRELLLAQISQMTGL